MKFKKIEISAFRIYDNPKDATFDFTMKDGAIADFISLYAPNGFGKTSFYDAIEWGMTGNIQRFWQNEAVAEKSITSQKEVSTQVKLWRHTNSLNKTYVRIEGDIGEPKTRELKFDGRNTIDAKNDKAENEDFRKVILSQEWISAFLKELDGERRYKIFMDNSNLKEYDNYYKGLKQLFNFCNERIGSLTNERERKLSQIVEITEDNLLESVNSTIVLLQNQGEQLEVVRLDMSKEEVMALRNLVSEKILAIPTTSLLEKLAYFRIARIGSETICGLEKYYEIPQSIEKSNKESKEYQDLLDKFKTIELFESELKTNADERKKVQGKLDAIEKLLHGFDSYAGIAKILQEKNKSKTENQGELIVVQEKLDTQRRLEIITNTDIDSLTSKISVIELQIKRVPDLKAIIEAAEKERPELQLKIDQFNSYLLELEGELKSSKQKEERLNQILTLLYENQVTSISEKEFPELTQLLQKQRERFSTVKELEIKYDDIEKEVKRNEELNSTINEFIQKGLEIVTSTETSTCPLCTQTYSSYLELSNKISSNSALSDSLQSLLARKSAMAVELNGIRDEVLGVSKELAQYFKGLIDKESNIQRNQSDNQVETQVKVQQAMETLRQMNEKIDTARKELESQNPEDRLKSLNELLLTDSNDLKEKRELLVEARSRISILSDQVTTIGGTIDLLLKEIGNLENDTTYKLFLEQYLSLFTSQEIDQLVLISRKDELSQQIQNSAKRFVNIEEQLISLNLVVASYNKETLTKNIDILIEFNEKLNLILRTYATFLKENLSIEIGVMKKEDLIRLLNEREASIRSDLEKQQQIEQNYQRLDKYSENLQPYLASESLKIRIKEIEAEVHFLTSTVQPRLRTERDKTREYLVIQVKKFFYTELINSLYNKIDPHPDFRSVEFRINFDSDNPRLDIYVINSSSDELLIPNLYFSTAQINILSLSIFLATALNSDEYNCIFIDDPIQSLDSINILSTIDLIRSIVINQQRQVVLSTHDENFHRLLEKKMPPEVFKSKFIELETFGKVKK